MITASYKNTVFPLIIAGGGGGGGLFEGRRLFEGGDYFKYCSLDVPALNILFYYPIESKKYHIK